MASGGRLNKVIDLLERGQVVFSSGTIMSDNLDDIMFVADSDYDFAIIEMEHQGFDFTYLRTALQYFLNRKRLVEHGTLQPNVVPFVRIPPNAREAGGNQWVIKQTLDTGGLRPRAPTPQHRRRRTGSRHRGAVSPGPRRPRFRAPGPARLVATARPSLLGADAAGLL